MTRLAKNVVCSLPLAVLHGGDHEIEKPHHLIKRARALQVLIPGSEASFATCAAG